MKIKKIITFFFVVIYMNVNAQDDVSLNCTSDTCITLLKDEGETLKRIVVVTSKTKNIYTKVGPKSYGYGTSEKNIVIPIQFDCAKAFHKGYAVVGVNNNFGIIDSLGNVVVPIRYKGLSNVNGGFVFFSINGEKVDGVMDLKGRKYLIDVQMGLMPVKGVTSMIVMNSSLGTFVYDDFNLIDYQFSEGLAIINNKVMNSEMKFIFTSSYHLEKMFHEGLVKMSWKSSSGNTLYGFIDAFGKIAIRPIYLSAEDFKDGRAEVTSGNPLKPIKQIIDKKGIVLKTIEYYKY